MSLTPAVSLAPAVSCTAAISRSAAPVMLVIDPTSPILVGSNLFHVIFRWSSSISSLWWLPIHHFLLLSFSATLLPNSSVTCLRTRILHSSLYRFISDFFFLSVFIVIVANSTFSLTIFVSHLFYYLFYLPLRFGCYPTLLQLLQFSSISTGGFFSLSSN